MCACNVELAHICPPCRRDALLAQDAEMEMAKRRKVKQLCIISPLMTSMCALVQYISASMPLLHCILL